MSNPFKVGDKVVRRPEFCDWPWSGYADHVCTVTQARGESGYIDLQIDWHPPDLWPGFNGWWDSHKFRAAIAGQDYPLPTGHSQAAAYLGHLPDGSSIQAHSAGGLYPFVLVWRDKRNGPDAHGKYDVGVVGPTNQDPIWCPCSDHAIKVAETLKEYKL